MAALGLRESVRRAPVTLLLGLLLVLSAMPDTMAAPVLKELLVDRYGASLREAQTFMAVNLLGAAAAIPLLVRARRRWSPVTLLVVASLADGVLLGALAAPVGLHASLAIRVAEGVTDVLVFASLFDLVRRAAGTHAAWGLGIASTPLLLGLGAGAVAGGIAAQRIAPDGAAGAGADVALAVFGVSALASVLVAVGALVYRRWIAGLAAVEPEDAPGAATGAAHAAGVRAGTFDDRPRPLAWTCVMAFFDRATGGLITTTLPGVLATFLGYSAGQRGWLIGLPLILMAVCTGPAGALCDRLGSLRVRLVAGAGYAVAFGLLPLAASSQPALGALMVAVGILAGTMFASSLALAAETGRGTVALGAFRAAGDLGFFAGTALSIAAVAALGGDGDATYADYAWMIAAFAAAHGASTLAIALLARRVS